ncbi:MAG: alpha/beta fold hydrolase [Actinobacteria bacterium]|nr:alpha/beta fold hydrolase [Actinomycetota bacterium]
MSDAPALPAFYTEPAIVEVDGVELRYRRRGSGEPLVYLGGAEMTRRWLPLFEELAGGCDLIALEGPGFGDTPAPPWLEGMDDLAIFYRRVLDALDLEAVHLVGYSLGAWIAAEFAVFNPGRLRSLALIAPQGVRVRGVPRADLFNISTTDRAQLLFNGAAERFAGFVGEGDEQETFFRAYAAAGTEALLAWNPRYDRKLDHRLPALGCPALVLCAEEDRVVPRAHAERYAELLGARLVTIAGREEPTAHGLVAQEPEAIAAALLELVGAVPARP